MSITIHNRDAIAWAKEHAGEKFHALLADTPYHLTSITKRLGKSDSAPIKFGKDGAFSRAAKGFMGNTWDGGDLAFQPETWDAFGQVLHAGAFGMAFASSRGWHRMAVAIEDAGFIIHPTIFLWAYGSGFPKATRIKDDPAFDGHRYGLQALKPAVEPIIVFQKPYEGRPLDNIRETGAGTFNIDAGRIGAEQIPSNRWKDAAHPFGDGVGNEYETVFSNGRWPANFLIGDQGASNALDKQTGILTSGKFEAHHVVTSEFPFGGGESGERSVHPQASSYGDNGGASRFFYNVQTRLDEADPVFYCAKSSRDEKESGLQDHISVSFGQSNAAQTAVNNGDETHSSLGLNSTKQVRNPHPTVKPLDLTRYLASLLLPPAEYAPRRLFVPFSGVASECIGAHLAGWDQIEGVESDTRNGYIEIAQKRIDYWTSIPTQLNLFK